MLKQINPVIGLMISIAYGLLVIFSFVGILAGRGFLPVTCLVITCLAWAGSKIIKEALNAFYILRAYYKADDTTKEE